MSNAKRIFAGIGALALVILTFILVYNLAKPQQEGSAGSKECTVEVYNNESKKETYTVKTNEEFVGGLLRELDKNNDSFSMETVESDYGAYIDSVNGLTADYIKDGAYWSVYLNDEYAQSGIDELAIADKDKIAIKYETD